MNNRLEKPAGPWIYRFVFVVTLGFVGFVTLAYLSLYLDDFLIEKMGKSFIFGKVGNIVFLMILFLWFLGLYRMSRKIFALRQNKFLKNQVRNLRILFHLSYIPFIIVLLMGMAAKIRPTVCEILLCSDTAIFFFLASIFMLAFLFLYYGGYKRISLQEIRWYPMQFLELSELEEYAKRLPRKRVYNRITYIIAMTIVIGLDYFSKLDLSEAYYAGVIAYLSIMEFNMRQRMLYARIKIQKLKQ